jgi:hypothetical protein
MTRKVALLRPAGLALAAGLFVPLLLFPPTRRPLDELALTPGATDYLPSETIEFAPIDPATSPAAASATPTLGPNETIEPTPGDSSTPPTAERLTPTSEATQTHAAAPSDDPPPTDTGTPTSEATETPTATHAAAPLPTDTETPTPVPSLTETASATPGLGSAPEPAEPLSVLIHEVAWAGTSASSSDEWIELHNPGSADIDLGGWVLSDGGALTIRLRGTLPGYGFFLLERTDDTTVSSVTADQIYAGSLNNGGEALELRGPLGEPVDSANADGGAWPAGNASTHANMERVGGTDGPGAWRTFTGCWSTGADADGRPVNGTPRQPNSVSCPTDTPPPSPTMTPTSTPTLTPSPTLAPTAAEPLAVLINEVAWAGTQADASDEWIELFNPGPSAIDLRGWRLTDEGDLQVALSGVLPPFGFLLLERTSDGTIADLPADLIYTGGLNNAGESLWLLDASGSVIDSANADGGGWPGGSATNSASMERRGGDDRTGNWGTFPGYGGVGRDADGNPIGGTPRRPNALNLPAPTSTPLPSRVVINEVLIRPHYDWEGSGGVTTGDEFIELYNAGSLPVRLLGWVLDDIEGGGSKPYTLGDAVLPAHGYLACFRSRTHLALNDSGDTVRLLAPDGRVVDQIAYLRVRAYNLSYGRLPDGGHHLVYGLWPTAGGVNVRFVPPRIPLPVLDTHACPAGHLHPLLVRFSDLPLARRHAETALITCP